MNKNSKITIIAEAGVNHNGRIVLAKKLIDAAKGGGADFVKFQTFSAEKLVSKQARKAQYQTDNMSDEEMHQFKMLKEMEINEAFHKELITYCNQRNIGFLSSPFDEQSIEMLYNLGLRIFKVPSGEITNLPYLKKLGSLNCSIILSTGMATMREIKAAFKILKEAGTGSEQITVLHCNTDYPTDFPDVNLKAMRTIEEELGVNVGYSDHTRGIEIPVAATAMGATVIEKHITIDINMRGPDHRASMEPDEFKKMVQAVRNVEKALGDGVKKPSESELKNKTVVRKSIHIARDLKEAQKITAEDLIMLRPGDGISPMNIEQVIGMETNKPLNKGHKLKESDLKF